MSEKKEGGRAGPPTDTSARSHYPPQEKKGTMATQLSNHTINIPRKSLRNATSDDDVLGASDSNENPKEKSSNHPKKSESMDDSTTNNQKMAMMEGGAIDEWSYVQSERKRVLGSRQVVSRAETEKASNTTRSIERDPRFARHHSSTARVPDSTSRQRGVDVSCNKRPPVPSRFCAQELPSCPSIPETNGSSSRPGAIAIPGPGAALSHSHSIDSLNEPLSEDHSSIGINHEESSNSIKSRSERLISAFLVEDEHERGENPPTLSSTLPLAEATAMVDTKTRLRRILFVVGCSLLVCIIGGAIAFTLLYVQPDKESEHPTSKPTTPDPTTQGSTDPPYQFWWNQAGEDIKGIDGEDFGRSVSSSRDGSILAAGARLAGVGEGPREGGQVRVFSLSDGTWGLLGNSILSQNDKDKLGQSVSLSDDGRTVAIGVPRLHKVQIWQIVDDDGDWSKIGQDIESEQTSIADSDANCYTSLSGDGLVVAIGSPWKDNNDQLDHGHVRVYEYKHSTGDWAKRGTDIDGFEAGDNLGFSTWLNRDGTILAAGAFQNIREKTHAGYACVYKWIDSKWNALGNCVQGETENDHFGVSVSMSGDASVLAVGGDLGGYVRVFKWNEINNTWNQTGNNIERDKNGDLSGFASVISYDGSIVAVGSPKGGEHESGLVRLFKYDTNTTLWEQVGQPIVGKEVGDRFGISLSLANNGTMVAIGSEEGGYVQVYNLTENLEY